jgi:branched-chain amino acid transport system permease protein
MGEPLMLRGFAVVVIGGLGDIRGALVAGLALGFVEVMTAGYLSSNFKEAAGFAAMVRVSRDREHGFHCIMSKYFAGS